VGQSGQAIKLFQITPYVVISSRPTIPVPDSLYRRLEKNSFTFHFWHKSFVTDDVKLAELSNNSFEWKCDFGGCKTYSDPSYIFSGSQDSSTPPPRIHAPANAEYWVQTVGPGRTPSPMYDCQQVPSHPRYFSSPTTSPEFPEISYKADLPAPRTRTQLPAECSK